MRQIPVRLRILTASLLLVAGSNGAHGQAPETLRVSVSSSWTMPYGDVQNERITGGILLDLYRAIAQKTGLTMVPVVLPRKRIDGAVVSGDIDLRCYFNPRWTSTPEIYEWSKPLWTIHDVLFGHEGTRELTSLTDMPRGTRISTSLGYTYPALEPLFVRGDAARDDSFDEDKVLLKMTASRTPYGVTKSEALDWYRRNTPQHRLAAWRLVLESTDVHCAAPRNAAVPPTRTLAAVEDLRKSGRVEAILRSYK